MAEAVPPSQLTTRPSPQDGPFILRKLVSDLPLSADGDAADVRITCVEVWSMYSLRNASWVLQSYVVYVANQSQTVTSTSAPQPPRSSTSSSCPQNPMTLLASPLPSSPRGWNRLIATPTALACSRSSSSLRSTRPAYYATTLSPSTRCPSSAPSPILSRLLVYGWAVLI